MEGKEQWEGRFGELAEALEEISAGVCSLNERDIFQSLTAILPALRDKEGISVRKVMRKGYRYLCLTRPGANADKEEYAENGQQQMIPEKHEEAGKNVHLPANAPAIVPHQYAMEVVTGDMLPPSPWDEPVENTGPERAWAQ